MTAAGKVILSGVEGIARKTGTDQHGARWIEFEVDYFAEQTPGTCDICGATLESGWLCLDGGEEVCSEHVEFAESGHAERAALADSVNQKLWPGRFPGMSGKMRAIVAHVLGMKPCTLPYLVGLTSTSDGFLLGRNAGDVGFNNFIGAVSDYVDNWERLITIPQVGLTPEELVYVRERYQGAAGL